MTRKRLYRDVIADKLLKYKFSDRELYDKVVKKVGVPTHMARMLEHGMEIYGVTLALEFLVEVDKAFFGTDFEYFEELDSEKLALEVLFEDLSFMDI